MKIESKRLILRNKEHNLKITRLNDGKIIMLNKMEGQ